MNEVYAVCLPRLTPLPIVASNSLLGFYRRHLFCLQSVGYSLERPPKVPGRMVRIVLELVLLLPLGYNC